MANQFYPLAAVGPVWRKFKNGEFMHDLIIVELVDSYAKCAVLDKRYATKTRIRTDALPKTVRRAGENFHYEFMRQEDDVPKYGWQ